MPVPVSAPPRFPLSLARAFETLRGTEPALRDAVAVFVAIKIGLLIVALLGSGRLLPFNWSLYQTNLLLDIQQMPDWSRIFNTWDTQHYVFLSRYGYGVNPMSNAFYPLYPYLIWLVTPVTLGEPLIAAYLVANVASLLVAVYMYKLSRLFYGTEQAFRITVLLLVFPTAFYLSVAYSEALYLSLCLMATYYLFVRDVNKATLVCFFLPLSRAQGLLYIVPIFTLFVGASIGRSGARRRAVSDAFRAYGPPAIATLLGMGVYFAVCRWQLGGFFEGLNAHQLYVGKSSLGNMLSPYRWFVANFTDISLQLHGYTNSWIDRAAFVACAPLLIGVYRTQHRALFAYAALALLVPALSGTFMSYTRVLLVVFPLFMYVGAHVKRAELIAIPMFALQVLLYLLHTSGYWVA